VMSSKFGKGCHLHLIDGSAFIFRAYHALPPLTRKSDGLPIGAVAGFCNMLQRYVEGNTGSDVTHVAVIFDKGSHTFRNDMYDQYKANREAMPEDLRPQVEGAVEKLFDRTVFFDRPTPKRLSNWRRKAQQAAAEQAVLNLEVQAVAETLF